MASELLPDCDWARELALMLGYKDHEGEPQRIGVDNLLMSVGDLLHVVQQHKKTLRDEIAMAALQGMLSNPEHDQINMRTYCREAYSYADAMLEARV